MTVSIVNNGEIDTAALYLMGASTKEGENKIGFFGSGNKYAIATLLRLGVPFTIYSGLDPIAIETRTVALKDQSFDQILIDGVGTSLTTRMGPDWEPWFALREFISNAMDEGGMEIGNIPPAPGRTTIVIERTPIIEPVLANLSQYFTQEPEGIIQSTDNVFRVYRKGILVSPHNQERSLYNYNFDKLDITESRLYKYDFEVFAKIANIYAKSEDEALIHQILSVDPGLVESERLRWDSVYEFSNTWVHVLKDRTLAPIAAKSVIGHDDLWAYTFLNDQLYDALKNCRPELRYLNGDNSSGWTELTDTLTPGVLAAVQRLQSYGYNICAKIKLGHFDDTATVAQFKDGEIRLRLGEEDELGVTILEEHYHYLGYRDSSRHFELQLMNELLSTWGQLVEAKRQLIAIKELLV